MHSNFWHCKTVLETEFITYQKLWFKFRATEPPIWIPEPSAWHKNAHLDLSAKSILSLLIALMMAIRLWIVLE